VLAGKPVRAIAQSSEMKHYVIARDELHALSTPIRTLAAT